MHQHMVKRYHQRMPGIPTVALAVGGKQPGERLAEHNVVTRAVEARSTDPVNAAPCTPADSPVSTAGTLARFVSALQALNIHLDGLDRSLDRVRGPAVPVEHATRLVQHAPETRIDAGQGVTSCFGARAADVAHCHALGF
jgi:hypothetical protein